jgi:oligopeptidase B
VLTSEVWLLDAADPSAEFSVVAPRRQGVDYDVEHAADRLLILHNDGGAENFEIATAALDDPGTWTPLVPHRADTRLLGVDAFADYTVVYFRRDGLTGLRILRKGRRARGRLRRAGLPGRAGREPGVPGQPVPAVLHLAGDPGLGLRLRHGHRRAHPAQAPAGAPLPGRRPLPVRGLRAAPGVGGGRRDGTRVPISLVCRKGTPRDGSAPCLLYGYGSYELSRDPAFSIPVLSLLDRGFVYAIAHIRGGGEMGRSWYTDGKLLHKRNTFTDFIACARHLAEDRLDVARATGGAGGSAGGLLMGAVANMAPEAFAGIVAHVPFVGRADHDP